MAVLLYSNNHIHWSDNTNSDPNASFHNESMTDYAIRIYTQQSNKMKFDLPDMIGDEVWFSWISAKDNAGDSRDDGYYARIYDAAGLEIARIEVFDANWYLQIYGTTTAETTRVYPGSGESFMKIRLKVTPTTIEADFFYDAIQIGTTLSVANNGKGVPKVFDFRLEDLYYGAHMISQFTMSEQELYNGGGQIRRPMTAGTDVGLGNNPAVLKDDIDLTGFITDVAGLKSSFNMQAPSSAGKAIHSYLPYAYVVAGSVARTVRMYLRIGGVQYNGANQVLLTGRPNYVKHEWLVDPSDGLVWTDAKIAAAEVGIEIVS